MVAVPLPDPVLKVIAERAAMVLALEPVNVTLVIADQELPSVRVSPVVVGNEKVTPEWPVIVITVEIPEPLEKPFEV
jgi:hypothetical protein